MARYPSSMLARRIMQRRRRIFAMLVIILAVAVTVVLARRNASSDNPAQLPIVDLDIPVVQVPQPIEIAPQETAPEPAPLVSSAPPPQPEPETQPLPQPQAEPAPAATQPVTTEPVAAQPAAPPQPPIEAIADPNSEASALVAKALMCLQASPPGIVEARDILNRALSKPMTKQQMLSVKAKLTELSAKWLFSPTVFENDTLCIAYRVEPGEYLANIAKDNKTPHEILQKINNIPDPTRLAAGATVKVVKGPFSAKVYLDSKTMDLYLQNTFVKTYRIGVGQEGKDTPTGDWRVKPNGKLVQAPWNDPVSGKLIHYGEPGYALGERWIGLDGIKGDCEGRTGFGIHGTNEPESIGKASSRGCIRLLNEDVIEFYDMLTNGISEVVVAK